MPKRLWNIRCSPKTTKVCPLCLNNKKKGLWSKVTVILVDYWSCNVGRKQTLPFMFSSWL